MTELAGKLDGLRQSLAGCQLIAYGDLQAELVLLSAGTERRPREYLDQLSAEAVRMFRAFDTADLPGGAEALSRSGLTVLLPGEVRLYMRGPEADFLCLVSDAPANSITFADPAGRFLDELARGGDD